MTDTGAYSDVVFGLFRLLGYRFSPRLADVGGTRFWRIDPKADYGLLNDISANQLSLQRIESHWDDMLRLAGSLKLGRVSAVGIMRTLQIGNKPTRLAQAIAEFGVASENGKNRTLSRVSAHLSVGGPAPKYTVLKDLCTNNSGPVPGLCCG
jgi:TnpA family transposase